MALLYDTGLFSVINSDSSIGVGWKLNFYVSGTTTRKATYPTESDATSVTNANSNPVVADSNGRFSAIWLTDTSYKVVLTDQNGIVKVTRDPAVTSSTTTNPGSYTVESFGAIGYSTAASAQAGHDNRTALQDAIDAVVTLGGGEIVLTKPHYGFAADARSYATDDIVANISGVGLVIDGAHVTFRSTCGGTRIYRRAQGMASPATWANWPLLSGGGAWRGGGIFLKGQTSTPTDYSNRAGITLDGVILDGGIALGSSYGAMNTTTGDGWDLSDKGIWSDGGRVNGSGIFTTGDIRVINGGGVIGFRGELVYGPNDTACTMFIRNGIFGETNGQCLNPNSCRLDAEGVYGYNANFAIEGWGGDRGRLTGAVFENCINGGSLQGGKYGAGTFSTFYAPTRVTSTITPYCEIDVTLKSCGSFNVGAWIKGRITAIDGRVAFSNGSMADGLFDTHLSEIVCITDQLTGTGVDFLGGDGAASANTSIRDVKIDRISFLRTKDAVAASRRPGTPVAWYASLGPRLVIGEAHGEVAAPPVYSAAWSDNAPNFMRTNFTDLQGYGNSTQNVQSTPALAWRGPFVSVTTTGTGSYPMLLPTTGIMEGAELVLTNSGPGVVYIDGNAAGGSGSGMRDGVGPVFLPLTGRTRFRFDATFWNYVDGGSRTFTTTVVNLPAASAVLQGVRGFVTDSNAALTAGIGAIVAAGGANKVPVVCDSANWRIG